VTFFENLTDCSSAWLLSTTVFHTNLVIHYFLKATSLTFASIINRSEQMPPIAQEIDPHPKSLNNITLSNLLQSSRNASASIEKFLSSDLSGITPAVAQRLAASLGISGSIAKSLQGKQVAALIQALRDEKQIKPPSGKESFFFL